MIFRSVPSPKVVKTDDYMGFTDLVTNRSIITTTRTYVLTNVIEETITLGSYIFKIPTSDSFLIPRF